MKYKKVFLCLLTVLLLFTLFSGFTMAQAPAVTRAAGAVPPEGVRLKFTNCAYPAKVMNVYTDYAPAQGDLVTLWSPSGSMQQSWRSYYIPGTNREYTVRCYYQTALALNYNIATTKCTLWSWFPNDPDDYYVTYGLGSYGQTLMLADRGRYLGASGSGNGAQLYWYFGQTAEENWTITAW